MASKKSRNTSGRVPKFSIPDHPQLESAMNALSDSVEKRTNVELREGRFIKIEGSQEDGYLIDLNKNASALASFPFRISFDITEQRLYIHPGHIAMADDESRLFLPYVPGLNLNFPTEDNDNAGVKLDAVLPENDPDLVAAGFTSTHPSPSSATVPPFVWLGQMDANVIYWIMMEFDDGKATIFVHDSNEPLKIPKTKWVLRLGTFRLLTHPDDGSSRILDPTYKPTSKGALDAVDDEDPNDPALDGGYEQEWESDVLVCCPLPLSLSGSGSGSDGDASGSDSGADKSTAIVPCTFHGTGYCALYNMEMPEIRFDDVFRFTMREPDIYADIDSRYIEVCAKDTVECCGLVSAQPITLGVCVENTTRLRVRASLVRRIMFRVCKRSWKPLRVVGRYTAIRKGFADGRWRFAPRTENQQTINDRFIRSAYPRDEIPGFNHFPDSED
jgi:hypothetical protein